MLGTNGIVICVVKRGEVKRGGPVETVRVITVLIVEASQIPKRLLCMADNNFF